MLPDPRVGDLAPPHPKRSQRSFLILHRPSAGHSRRYRLHQYRREMARDARSVPSNHQPHVTAHGTLATAPAVRWFTPWLRGRAGEAIAMSWGKSCAAAIVALGFGAGSPADQAFAYSATGDRLSGDAGVAAEIAPTATSSTSGPIPCRKLPRALAAAPHGRATSRQSMTRRSPTGSASSSRKPGAGSTGSPRAPGRQCRISTPRSNTWRSTISPTNFC